MIRVWEYIGNYREEKKEIHAAIREVLQSGQLILGKHVKEFEKKFAGYSGMPYGVGVNSGTDALFLALKASGIERGDEIITVSNTAVPTVSAIVSAGGVPRFVDIHPKTYLMDISQIERAITRKTKAILPVHLYGQCVDMKSVTEIAGKHGLRVIEDCAQSHGAEFNGKRAGSFSDFSAFSFYPTKVLGGYGDGGMVLCNCEENYKKLLRLRFYGMEKGYYSEEHGYNSRLDELHAAILLKKLSHLNDYIKQRREIAGLYDEALPGTSLVLPHRDKRCRHVFYLYVCRHEKRDEIISKLAERKIFVNVSYPCPIHTMKGYRFLNYREGDLPETESAAKEIFSLPVYPGLEQNKQLKVIEALRLILKKL